MRSASNGPDGARGPSSLAVVGATASGKTEVGILLAGALGTEVIGCDSRQVYRRLDVGTAKPTAEERRRARHHLVDFVEPAERFSAGRYRDAAAAVLASMRGAGMLPLFVGGTGLYLRAAVAGLCPSPPASPGLRRWLGALAGEMSGGLHPLLARVDPAAAARIHPNDRYRATRALEVYLLAGEPLAESQRRHRAGSAPDGGCLVVGLAVGADELRGRIARRIDLMVEAGIVDEVRRLLDEGLDPGLPAMRAVGYPEIAAHLRGETTLEAALEATRRATWQYARRQLIWFRALPGIRWVEAGDGRRPAAVADEVLGILAAAREAA